ncbi:aminoglycoside phosphotransferase family protein [Arthrobacter sp. IA7]|uniref:aminoglycoside phosphotransferase family protein n=1 Tax=Arthrobacter ipis TaxID=2716202 RepID=UPI001687A034|nr:phosphotransferase [Arthrobacter ipis]MBD1544412.1 aminoglycoside phosphotransferase family protein [Arthrobacter ipis]
MNASPSGFSNPDQSLARRDAALPALSWLLDNTRLSELLGETVRVTRCRYKPGTSLLVAFRRIRNGSFDYGWAYTLAAPVAKLLRRESTSRSRGGNMRVLRPDPGQQDTLVAVGGVEDDWALYKNLLWLREHGAERLGISSRPGGTLLAGSSVLRYKPERRLVLSAHQASTAVVIKAAAKPATAGQQTHFLDRLRLHGVPLLPQLGDAECLDHGISACVAWGGGDLAGLDDEPGAIAAGEALARLHGVADPVIQDSAGSWPAGITTQLQATSNMVSSLLPSLEETARRIEAELSALLLNGGQPGPVLVHGDFSPDQVLVGGSEVRLIDFDRAHAGTAEADLGSFAAAEETVLPASGGAPARDVSAGGASAGGPKTAGLMDGYLQAGGRFTQSGVDAWAAFRLFNSSIDPFRDRSPEWAADMSWHLSRAKELIP